MLGASGARWAQAMEGPEQAGTAGARPVQQEVGRKQLTGEEQLDPPGPPMPLAEPVPAAQDDGGTEVYTGGPPLLQVSPSTELDRNNSELSNRLRPRKKIDYCEDTDVLTFYSRMKGKFNSQTPRRFMKSSKTLGAVRKMLGRRDYSLSNIERQVGLLEITAKYADVESSRKLIKQRLDREDKHHISPTTDCDHI